MHRVIGFLALIVLASACGEPGMSVSEYATAAETVVVKMEADFERIEAQLAETLSADDVMTLAEAMRPGSVAAALVYENLWAAPFASAMRRAGGQLVADGRIPIQAIIAAVEADAALEAEGV